MATHSSTFAWRIPWMEEPGRLQSMGLLSRTRLKRLSSSSSNSSNSLLMKERNVFKLREWLQAPHLQDVFWIIFTSKRYLFIELAVVMGPGVYLVDPFPPQAPKSCMAFLDPLEGIYPLPSPGLTLFKRGSPPKWATFSSFKSSGLSSSSAHHL